MFKIIHKLVDETEKSSRESSCESDKENVSSNDQKGSECEREDGAEKSGGGEMSLENSPIEGDQGLVESNGEAEAKVEEEEAEWEVEKIVGHKKKKGKLFYKVKWLGWGATSNTWEPEEHLEGTEALEEYKESKDLGNGSNSGKKPGNGSDTEEETEEKEEKEPEPDWEVETIEDYQYCREQQAGLYLVKWVGWGPESNTWEPETNLQCSDLLVQFYHTRLKEREGATPVEKRVLELPPDPRERFQIRQDFLRENCPPITKRQMEKLFQADIVKPYHKRARLVREKDINVAVDACIQRKNESKLKWIREQLAIKSMLLERKSQMLDIKKYEEEINQIDPHAHVFVINDVDLEGPPRQMEYINAYKAGAGISIPDDPFIGCSCDVCGWNQKNCCPKTSGDFHFAYNKHGKLRDMIGVSFIVELLLWNSLLLIVIVNCRLGVLFTSVTRSASAAPTVVTAWCRRGGSTSWPSSGRTTGAGGE